MSKSKSEFRVYAEPRSVRVDVARLLNVVYVLIPGRQLFIWAKVLRLLRASATRWGKRREGNREQRRTIRQKYWCRHLRMQEVEMQLEEEHDFYDSMVNFLTILRRSLRQ